MFLRSRATPELLRRVKLHGGGCFCVGRQEEQQMDDIRVKMHSRFQSGPLMKASPGSGICLEQIRWKGNSEMPLHSSGAQEGSAQEAALARVGPSLEPTGSSWR